MELVLCADALAEAQCARLILWRFALLRQGHGGRFGLGRRSLRMIENDNGITIGELKKFLEQFPDDGEVWVVTKHLGGGCGLTNVSVKVSRLNKGDVLVETREKLEGVEND